MASSLQMTRLTALSRSSGGREIARCRFPPGGEVEQRCSGNEAYRDLEREGLVEPRAGHGTFVLRRPPGPPPGTHARLARSLAQWVRGAREAGLDDDSIESLLRVILQAADGAEIA